MYEITSRLYEETAERLCDAIGSGTYFTGSIEFNFEDTECRLTATVIVYRRHVELPEGEYEAIDDIVPVWWEFHTTGDDEMLNDFSFATLKGYIC